ncbi:nuclear transport factor 2 family protein [Nonomuraea sp. NPDC050663]|uniref:nuclear transport factor 2 family protein n=1 Tax=Nonomuraea sp. NPDC050663 TaxID=3364370 RepID=UPI003796A76F
MAQPDFHAFLTRLPHELAFSEDDPASIIDRYYTPDVRYHNDGITLDRQRLIDHVGPARRTATRLEVEVHDTVVEGSMASARYTMTAVTRKDRVIRMEIYLFARYAADGRVERVDSITRPIG